jgi:hypothetical protein
VVLRCKPVGILEVEQKKKGKKKERNDRVFVGAPGGKTLFVGLCSAEFIGVGTTDLPRPHRPENDKAGAYDLYKLEQQDAMRDLDGKLYVDWGSGTRAWAQRAAKQNKPITEIRLAFKEEEFPGFSQFVKSLSEIDALPASWIEALRTTKGIYLLTCPKTKEQRAALLDRCRSSEWRSKGSHFETWLFSKPRRTPAGHHGAVGKAHLR